MKKGNERGDMAEGTQWPHDKTNVRLWNRPTMPLHPRRGGRIIYMAAGEGRKRQQAARVLLREMHPSKGGQAQAAGKGVQLKGGEEGG